MSKRLNDKTQSDMSGQGSSGDGSGEMTAELWGEVYDLLCLKMKTDDAYAKLRAKGDDMMCEQIRSKMRKLTEPQKGTSKKTIKKIQKKKTSKPTAVVVPTGAAAATPTTTTTTTTTTAPVTTTTTTTTAATATIAAATTDTETMGTSFLKPATPETSAKRRSRKKLSLKISPQEQLTPDVSSAQTVLEQWWEQTLREPTYSPNAPVTMATGDLDDHEALKLATLPSMDLDTLPLLEASWSPASPEDVHVYSSGMPMVCDDDDDDDDDDNVDLDPYGEAQLTPLQRECSTCRHNNMLRYISCNSGQVMCHVCGLELIDCTCMLTYDKYDDMPIASEDHILWYR
ncbi:uncharacterized protein [Haliotis cracherodii]|uniref:uncharacterized protein n=1 Tax=Haliotis cracherodii TaxID=6455 RepID=UPI0039E8BA31